MLDRLSTMGYSSPMNKLSIEKRAQIIGCLVEGNSMRATCRMTGAAKGTVNKLLRDIGAACAAYQDKTLRNLKCKRVQVDEIWSFVYAKKANVSEAKAAPADAGDIWTWTAIDADTKLVPSFTVGDRSYETGKEFISDLASRLATRIQLTSDDYRVYLTAVEEAFHGDVDYSTLTKIYGPSGERKKWSPPEVIGTRAKHINGKPDRKHCSTSFVERQNLNMRMSMRRFTRLTNAFSKKAENLYYAVALHFMYYNFGRIHQSLRVTPAMEAGVSDHVWSLEEIAALMQ